MPDGARSASGRAGRGGLRPSVRIHEMLKIRREQQEALGRPFRQRFREELLRFVRDKAPGASAAEDEALVEYAIARARRHGVVSCADVARYIAFMVTLGRDFDMDPNLPWAQAILRDPTVSGGQKMENLLERALKS